MEFNTGFFLCKIFGFINDFYRACTNFQNRGKTDAITKKWPKKQNKGKVRRLKDRR